MTTPEPASPVSHAERIQAIDIVRGFALLGVLLMNDQYVFRGPDAAYDLVGHPFPGAVDVAADWILAIFFEAKSVSLFSFLFGVGLAIQLERADARGVGFGGYALRRLGALLGIAALHVLLIWWGDILHIYAVLGFLLLLFLRRQAGTVLRWAMVLFVLPLFARLLFLVIRTALGPAGGRPLMPAVDAAAYIHDAIRAYQNGGWLDAAVFRLRDYAGHTNLGLVAIFLPYAFALFLLGLWTWRRGILRAPEEHERALRRLIAIGLPVGLGLATAFTLVREIVFPRRTILGSVLRALNDGVGTPLLALSYGAGLLLLAQRPAWQRLLAPLAPVGRMALTNYLMQSLVMTWVFNAYGLGLYGKVGPAAAALLCLALFAFQMAASDFWLARYRFGPAEWLWRSLTYARRQPMRR